MVLPVKLEFLLPFHPYSSFHTQVKSYISVKFFVMSADNAANTTVVAVLNLELEINVRFMCQTALLY